MATWTAVPDSSLEPGKPIRSIDAIALRDNPVAIAEGAFGAPKIVSDSAINWNGGGAGVAPAVNWVGAKTSLLSAGAVGSYAFARRASGTFTTTFGGTIEGSLLRPVGVIEAGIIVSLSLALSGTWRCMGHTEWNNPYGNAATLWLRIA